MLRLLAFAERMFQRSRASSPKPFGRAWDMPHSSTHDALRHYWIDTLDRR